MTSMVFI